MKRVIPALIAIVLIILIAGIALGGQLLEKYSYSDEKANLNEYFGITDAKQVVMTIFFTDQLGLVEKREQVAAGLYIGAKVEETACLSHALRVVGQGIA